MRRYSPMRHTIALGAGMLAVAMSLPAAAQDRGAAAAKTARPAVLPSEELIRIPREGTAGGMLTRVCRPPVQRLAPLVVINHGSPPVATDRAGRMPSRCRSEVARFFTSRGYVVAFPLRRGYGETGGAWAEAYGKCDNANFLAGGAATADDIEAALAHLRTLPLVETANTIVIGQSAGGWGTLALAARNPPGVRTFINFAGGRGAKLLGPGVYSNCSPDALVAAAAALGRSTRAPTLWIYSENDRLVGRELSQRLQAAYKGAGGKVRYELLPPFGDDGHNLFFGTGGSAQWGPIVDNWLVQSKTP